MKKVLSALLIFFILSSCLPSTAHCDTPMKKLGRGLANSVTFLMEIPEQIKRTNARDGVVPAMTYGAVTGLVMALIRAGVGVYEVVTFPFPFPGDYKPILTDPEFFFEVKDW